ncbi:MAG: DUF1629 domain-containing protein [Pseudomonadota bacterium]
MATPARPKIWVTDLLAQVPKRMDAEYPAGLERLERKRGITDPLSDFEPVDTHALPEFFFASGGPSSAFLKRPPDAFVSGEPLVSKRFRDLLLQFDMGSTRFHPVELRRMNKKTPLEQAEYFILNVTERKQGAVDRDASGIRLINTEKGIWRQSWDQPFGVFTIHAWAAEGVDPWGERRIADTLFLSDRLAKAMKAERIRGPKLIPCTVAD